VLSRKRKSKTRPGHISPANSVPVQKEKENFSKDII
jgi:hypothetical protein